MKKIAAAVSIGMKLCRVREPLIGAEWADRCFYLSPESSAIEGKWKTYPYQVAWINWMTDDDIREINNQKCARVGYTKCVIIAAGYGTSEKHRNIVAWQPTDGDAQDFVSDEVDPMLRDVPEVGRILKCPVGSKSKFNTNEKKSFVGSTFDIKGGKSARNYRRMTKDIAIYDELDGFDLDIDNEGSALKLGDIRIQTSPFKKSIRGSTPKTKGVSLIEAAVDSCKMVFYRFLPCPHCGVMQRLEFSNLKTKPEEAGLYICNQNGCVIDYADYPSMDEKGQWQTLDGHYYDDKTDMFYDPKGQLADRPRKVSTKIWAAYSYYLTWREIAEEWREANERAKTGDKTLLKSFINTVLGETWEEKGKTVEATGFMELLEDYTDENLPAGIICITCGSDVQGGTNPRIEMEILGHGFEGETWSIDYVVLPGDIRDKKVLEDHDAQLNRKFIREDGLEMMITGGLMDSGFQTSEVYNYTSVRNRRGIFACKGVNTGELCKASTSAFKKFTKKVALMTVNVDDAKDTVFTRLKKEKGQPGYCHFPAHYTQQYFDSLTNEEKKEKKHAGRIIGYTWSKKKEHMPNEALDVRVYNLAALQRYIDKNKTFLQQLKFQQDKQVERMRAGVQDVKPTGRRVRSSGLPRA